MNTGYGLLAAVSQQGAVSGNIAAASTEIDETIGRLRESVDFLDALLNRMIQLDVRLHGEYPETEASEQKPSPAPNCAVNVLVGTLDGLHWRLTIAEGVIRRLERIA